MSWDQIDRSILLVSSLGDRCDKAALQVVFDALLHFSRKLRHRPYQFFGVDSERDFLEHGKRNPTASFSCSEGTVVVKADTHSDRDSCRAVSGAHEERIPEFICRSSLPHHGNRETAGVKCMSRAGGHGHDTAQAFLNEQEAESLDMNRRGRGFV